MMVMQDAKTCRILLISRNETAFSSLSGFFTVSQISFISAAEKFCSQLR